MNFKTFAAFVVAGAACALVSPANAQSATTFTYQGTLADSGSPADGMYEFQVRLLDGMGVQVGLTQSLMVDVTQGMFMLDQRAPGARVRGRGRDPMFPSIDRVVSLRLPVTTPHTQYSTCLERVLRNPIGYCSAELLFSLYGFRCTQSPVLREQPALARRT